MTRNEIVERLFVGRSFSECIAKMEPDHLRDDLRQEVITVVLELPEEKLLDLHSQGVLEYFTVRIILNMIKSKTSPFYKKYRVANEQYIEHEYLQTNREYRNREIANACGMKGTDDTVEDRETREALEDLALENIDKLYWYDSELLRLYMQLGNYRAIEKKTGIPFISCYKNIQKSIQTLRRMVKGEVPEPLFSKEELRAIQKKS